MVEGEVAPSQVGKVSPNHLHVVHFGVIPFGTREHFVCKEYQLTPQLKQGYKLPLSKSKGSNKVEDAEYHLNCNTGMFSKWMCWNISEVMLGVRISPKYTNAQISRKILKVNSSRKFQP